MVMPSEAIAALEKGNKIEAIKYVRHANRSDLKDSKDFVEQYLRDNPSLEQRYSTIQSEGNRSGLLKVLLIIAAISTILYFMIEKL